MSERLWNVWAEVGTVITRPGDAVTLPTLPGKPVALTTPTGHGDTLDPGNHPADEQPPGDEGDEDRNAGPDQALVEVLDERVGLERKQHPRKGSDAASLDEMAWSVHGDR